jgi:aryl-alcohol dehydrogenase-like predicted oxidoreductase
VSKFTSSKSKREFNNQFIKSLNDLNQKKIYGYLAHKPLELLSNDWEWTSLKNLKSKSLVSKIGYSLNHPDELKKLLSSGLIPDIVQVPFNYFDKRFEIYFKELKQLNVEIHCRSIFLQGIFQRN